VGITGRLDARTRVAASDIARRSGHPEVDAFPADMSSQARLRRLAAAVLRAYPGWTCWSTTSAALGHPPRHGRRPGAHVRGEPSGAFLLTDCCAIRSSPARRPDRHLASNAQATGRLDFDDLQGERDYAGGRAYSQSKLANVMFTYQLARRLDGRASPRTSCTPAW